MSEKMNSIEKTRIQELLDEVGTYKQAIQDARDALASAEAELDDALAASFEKEKN